MISVLLCDLSGHFFVLFFLAFGWVIAGLLQRRVCAEKLIPARNQGVERGGSVEDEDATMNKSTERAARLAIDDEMGAVCFLGAKGNMFAVGAEREPAYGGVTVPFDAIDHCELLISSTADERDAFAIRAHDRRFKNLVKTGGFLPSVTANAWPPSLAANARRDPSRLTAGGAMIASNSSDAP